MCATHQSPERHRGRQEPCPDPRQLQSVTHVVTVCAVDDQEYDALEKVVVILGHQQAQPKLSDVLLVELDEVCAILDKRHDHYLGRRGIVIGIIVFVWDLKA